MRTIDLFKFIRARHCIYLMREAGNRKPWTGDPILQKYRFCNVYRELDTVTQWISKHWRTPHENDRHLWFAMVVARLFNNVETLEELGFPKEFDIVQMSLILHARKSDGNRVFNPAYIVSTNGRALDKIDYVLQEILRPMWENKAMMVPHESDTLEAVYFRLLRCNGMGTFMSAQIVADLKYTPMLKNAADWWTFAASGPGSRRGLNRVMEAEPEARWREQDWHNTLMRLHDEINTLMVGHNMVNLHAQDLQNCLCEFDKYERVRLGEGRPKQLYPGAA